ncbi:MAG TPA: hypothetical protein VG817_03280, partial [Gemmatimonadales bacterium]|nr:hypothetical protein [Gemmatimonadales bacterium]
NGHQVLGVLAIPLMKSDVAGSDREIAEKCGLTILDGEDLLGLLELVRRGAGPGDTLDEIRRLRLPGRHAHMQ